MVSDKTIYKAFRIHKNLLKRIGVGGGGGGQGGHSAPPPPKKKKKKSGKSSGKFNNKFGKIRANSIIIRAKAMGNSGKNNGKFGKKQWEIQ